MYLSVKWNVSIVEHAPRNESMLGLMRGSLGVSAECVQTGSGALQSRAQVKGQAGLQIALQAFEIRKRVWSMPISKGTFLLLGQ